MAIHQQDPDAEKLSYPGCSEEAGIRPLSRVTVNLQAKGKSELNQSPGCNIYSIIMQDPLPSRDRK